MPRRKQLTAPEPPADALAQARAHVRERTQQFDTEILQALNDAITIEQAEFERQYLTAEWQQTEDMFPSICGIILKPSPVLQILSIAYTDQDDQPASWDSGWELINDTEPAYIRPTAGETYPAGTNVVITYESGYGAEWANIPDEYRRVILERTYETYRKVDYGEKLMRLRRLQMVGDVFSPNS